MIECIENLVLSVLEQLSLSIDESGSAKQGRYSPLCSPLSTQ